jgi:hypothetical protein
VDSGRVWQTTSKHNYRGGGEGRPEPASWLRVRGRASVAGIACIAIGAALAIAGCGGSSSSAEPTDSAFVSSGNAACKTAFSQALAVKKPARSSEVPAYVAQLNPIAYTLLAKLNALSPPPGKTTEYTKMLALWRQEISLATARGAALKAGDERRGQAIDEEGHGVDQQFDNAATVLGLTVCAHNL